MNNTYELSELLARYERQAQRFGELWERCQGKGWPEAEDREFTRIRDETLPALKSQIMAGPAPELPEVAAWRAARREVEGATEAYNAALIEARAKDEVHGFGSTSVDAEYQAMNSASNAVISLVRPMLAALDKA